MKQKVDKTWMYLVAAARRIWRWSSERKQIKKAATSCAICKEYFKNDKEKEIDHIDPIGKAPRTFSGWDRYYSRLFCTVGGLQALCRRCHKEKSQNERLKGKFK